eukprot:2002530-Alexandrium_andersonii.AAC.1
MHVMSGRNERAKLKRFRLRTGKRNTRADSDIGHPIAWTMLRKPFVATTTDVKTSRNHAIGHTCWWKTAKYKWLSYHCPGDRVSNFIISSSVALASAKPETLQCAGLFMF